MLPDAHGGDAGEAAELHGFNSIAGDDRRERVGDQSGLCRRGRYLPKEHFFFKSLANITSKK
jgi:hypothetical protein